MIDARLDRRLTARVDAEDVLQDAWLAASARFSRFQREAAGSPRVWLRTIVAQILVDTHRRHLTAVSRTAVREEALEADPEVATSARLVVESSPRRIAVRGEAVNALTAALDDLGPLDRKVILLRHFDGLGNDHVSHELGVSRTAANNRYTRALVRLRALLEKH